MKRNFKKLFLWICLMAAIPFLFHTNAFAAENSVVDSGKCGNNVSWDFYEDGTVIFTGTGDMYENLWSSDLRDYRTDIKKAIIQEGITSIGASLFQSYTSLEWVELPKGLITVGAFAFSDCHNLAEIQLPDSVNFIDSSAFSSCYRLKEFTVPEGITTIPRSMLWQCVDIVTVNLPDTVTEIGGLAFAGCNKLAGITLPENLTDLGWGTFYDCYALTEITLPEKISVINDEVFRNCENLKTVRPLGEITWIGKQAFYCCSKLENFKIQNTVEFIGQEAFCACSSLKEIALPDGLTTIEPRTFASCGSLKELIIPESVTSIGIEAFSYCSNLTKVSLPSKLEIIPEEAFYECRSLEEIIIPKNVTTIGDQAFYECRSLREVLLPEGLETIGSQAFRDCNSLTELVLPQTLTSISWCPFSKYFTLFCYKDSIGHDYAKKYSIPYLLIDELEDFPSQGSVERIFADIHTDWYTEYVQYAYDNKLMNGIKGTPFFEPSNPITKAQVAQILYNLEGTPTVTNTRACEELNDLVPYSWYLPAVCWAYDQGIITGDLNTKEFSPDANVTREQLVLMMYRYAAYKEYDIAKSKDLAEFIHQENVSNWARTSVEWAVGSSLISGIELFDETGNITGYDLLPQGNATRAQAAAIMMRFCETF